MSNTEITTRLPTIDTSERLIHGYILKCIDGRWSVADTNRQVESGTRLLALHNTRALQHWQNKSPTETIVERPGEVLPDVDQLNAAIPQSAWEMDLNDELRPPWQKQYVVYLLDLNDATILTFLNSTVGARIAWEKLDDRTQWMRALRGNNTFPVVELTSMPMKINKGAMTKQRPEFCVVEWIQLGTGSSPAIAAPPPSVIAKPVAPIGRPVKLVAVSEALNDEIPF